jgi:hypothetical protein
MIPRARRWLPAKYRDDNAGSLTTGGTSTAYTLTSNQVFASLSAMSGMSLRVKFNATNGASPTLNVDGLGAKAIHTVTGTAVATGVIKANATYSVVYDNSNSCWILVGAPADALIAPSGTVMLFRQTSAPTGWTKDAVLNDYALRLVTGTASTGGSTAFTSIFAARTIAQANLPNVNFTVTDPGHSHTMLGAGIYGSGAVTGPAGSGPPTFNTSSTTTGISVASGGSGTALDFAVKYADVISATKD